MEENNSALAELSTFLDTHYFPVRDLQQWEPSVLTVLLSAESLPGVFATLFFKQLFP